MNDIDWVFIFLFGLGFISSLILAVIIAKWPPTIPDEPKKKKTNS